MTRLTAAGRLEEGRDGGGDRGRREGRYSLEGSELGEVERGKLIHRCMDGNVAVEGEDIYQISLSSSSARLNEELKQRTE